MENKMATNQNELTALIFDKNELFQLWQLCESERARLTFVKPFGDEHAKIIKSNQDFYSELAVKFGQPFHALQQLAQ
jgi:hypothetical protein